MKDGWYFFFFYFVKTKKINVVMSMNTFVW